MQETIFHPGFYRVALAVKSLDELPPDPVAVTRADREGPAVSVGGDSKQSAEAGAGGRPESFITRAPHRARSWRRSKPTSTLPNINCEKCTLQIVQFMEAHGLNKDGDYTYHHCADIKITADPSKPIDKEWQGQQ